MNAGVENRLEQLFAEAMALEPNRRHAFLRQVEISEPGIAEDLRRFVLALESAPGFLADPPSLPVEELLASALGAPAPLDERLPDAGIVGYRLRRRLGAGGMGVVYEARQEKPSRLVALKLLRALSASRSTIARFEAEAEALARLQHPGIAQIFEVGQVRLDGEPVPYLAMELVPDARNLIDFAKAESLPQGGRLQLFVDVCDAVQHAHSSGVVHRDLKPANLLVGRDGRVKVIDFGIARITEADAGSAARTHTRGLLGTVAYMSPEQVSGRSSEVDTRSDVYSLGVVLYELLCEAGPYDLDDATFPEILRIISQQSPVAPSRRKSTIKGDLETILLKALSKRREDRYASVTDLADDIRRYLRRTPIRARRAGMLHRAGLFARRKPGLIVSLGSVALLLLAGGAITTALWSRAERSQKAERLQREEVQLARAELDELRRSIGARNGLREPGASGATLLEPLTSGLVESVRRSLSSASSDAERARLLGVAIETLQRLEGTTYRDALLLEEIAETYVDLGDLYGDDWLAGADKVIGAVRAYRRGAEVYADLSAADPAQPRLVRGAALALTSLSQSLRKQNRFEDARAAADDAVSISTRLVEEFPDDPAAARSLIGALWARGDAVIELENPDLGLSDSRRSVELAERLRERAPDARSTYHMLAWSYFRVAVWLDAQFEDLAAALPNQIAATDAGLELIRRFPDDRSGMLHLLWNQRREADAILRADGAANVLPRIARIQADVREVVESRPLDAHVLRTVHMTLAGTADQFAELGRAEDALSLLRDVDQWFRGLPVSADDPDTVESLIEATRAQIGRIKSGAS